MAAGEVPHLHTNHIRDVVNMVEPTTSLSIYRQCVCLLAYLVGWWVRMSRHEGNLTNRRDYEPRD